MQHFIPNYLVHRLDKSWDILSIGCGTGADIEILRQMGYRAFGFDPSRHRHYSRRDNSVRPFLRCGTAEERPFGDQKFDYAYALEVIEHVGCVKFGTRVMGDYWQRRVKFMRSCLMTLKTGGRLFLSSSNRLCPVDPGHSHNYHCLGRELGKEWGISVPWSPSNFLVSLGDIANLADAAVGPDMTYVSTVTFKDYPKVSQARSWKGSMTRAAIKVLDYPLLRASPLSPLLTVEVTML